MELFHELYSAFKRRIRMMRGREPRLYPEVKVASLNYGNTNARWRVAPQFLAADSVVYSFGVGEDVSFDLAIIEHCGVQVHAFDPTPRSLLWLQSQDMPPGFRFSPLGLHQSDGQLVFYPPTNPGYVSFSANQKGRGTEGIALEVKRLGSLMADLGHTRIDLLKMDIEGSEYGVIEDMVASGYEIQQLLIEFHHWMPGFTSGDTVKAVETLRRAGYRLFAISAAGKEYSFIHERVLSVGDCFSA